MPVALKLTVSKAEPLLRGQDHFWRVIRTLGHDGHEFTAAQVGSVSQDHVGTITGYLRRLVGAGYLERVARKRSPTSKRHETHYRLIRAPEATPIVAANGGPAKRQTSRQHMWTIMRSSATRSGFSYQDLMVRAATEDCPISANTAKSFIQEIKSPYLIQLDAGCAGRPAVWRLRPAMNTGPLPPMTLRAKLVYDQNRSRVMGDVIAEEDG